MNGRMSYYVWRKWRKWKKKYCAASLEKFEWLKQWIELKLCQLKYEESATSRVLLKAYIIISKTA